MVYGFYSDKDPMNLLKNRNIHNTCKTNYNCGGYALGTFSWYCPHSEKQHGYYDTYSEESLFEQVMGHVKIMLAEFPTLRIIYALEEASENEEVIAFRLSNYDFHFMVRKANKRWYHKRGSCPFIYSITEEEVFSDCWMPDYDSPIVLMAMKKD